jgi:hypothetical protein
LPNVKTLPSDSRIDLIKLFAFGTFADYKAASAGIYPKLSETQLFKLKQLSLVSHCTSNDQKKKSWTIKELAQVLDLSSQEAVEELIVATNYAGLISGRINQRTNVFELTWSSSRDLTISSLSILSESLTVWEKDVKSALQSVEAQISDLTRALQFSHDEKLALETEKQLRIQSRGGGGGGRGGRGKGGGGKQGGSQHSQHLGSGEYGYGLGGGDGEGGGGNGDSQEASTQELIARMMTEDVLYGGGGGGGGGGGRGGGVGGRDNNEREESGGRMNPDSMLRSVSSLNERGGDEGNLEIFNNTLIGGDPKRHKKEEHEQQLRRSTDGS